MCSRCVLLGRDKDTNYDSRLAWEFQEKIEGMAKESKGLVIFTETVPDEQEKIDEYMDGQTFLHQCMTLKLLIFVSVFFYQEIFSLSLL